MARRQGVGAKLRLARSGDSLCKRRVFVFAGGESDPPAGGLMCIDPATGRVDFSFSVAQPVL
jgi:hypothetical protein